MSGNTGQIVGGIVGAVVGYFAGGNVAAGWAIGSSIGAALDPEKVEGPRLQDRKVQVSAYGVPIPILYGGDAGTGNIIWADEIKETATEESGKGGPEVTTYSYSVSCAVLIGEGPLGQSIPGIRRIWADAKLVYDVSVDASELTRLASSEFAQYFTFYGGSEDPDVQMPDPTMQAALGGDVPAYLGVCYVVFTDLPLGDYGNRIPNFKFETAAHEETVSDSGEEIYEALKIYPWTIGDGGRPVHSQGPTQFNAMDSETTAFTDYAAAAAFNAEHAPLAGGGNTGRTSTAFIGYSSFGGSHQNGLANVFEGGASLSHDFQTLVYHLADPSVANDLTIVEASGGTVAWCSAMIAWGAVANDGKTYWVRDSGAGAGSGVTFVTKAACDGEPGSGPFSHVLTGCPGLPGECSVVGVVLGNCIMALSVTRLPALPANTTGCPEGDPCLSPVPVKFHGHPGYCLSCSGEVTRDTGVTWELETGTFRQLAQIEYRDGVLYQNGLGPVIADDDPRYNDSAYWAEQRLLAIAAGTLRDDVASPVDVTERAKGIVNDSELIVAEELDTTLDLIVADICQRAGMSSMQYDVSALAGIVVQGYTLGRRFQARGALLPLQQAFWWDFVESGGRIRAVLRGNGGLPPGNTITVDDLGAAEGDETAPTVVSTRSQAEELPAEVSVVAPVRNAAYEPGAQRARRMTSGSDQKLALELAVVMTPQKAAEVADVLMYQAWSGRTTREFTTTRKWTRLEPTDVVTLNDGEFTAVVRIMERTDDGPLIRWKAVDDSPAAYSPVVEPGIGLGGGGGGVKFVGPTKLELIDCPILLDANDDAGLYAAAAGYLPGWPGAVVFKSGDGGTAYANVGAIPNASAIGYAIGVLPTFAGGNMVDETNTVDVRMHSGTLATITQDGLLDDGNMAILGSELLQFKRAELLSAGIYRLSGLLRGRRGTEQHMAGHAVNDRFVLFSPTATARLAGTLTDIGAVRHYKPVTVGQALSAAMAQEFTSAGNGLKPLSPAHLRVVALGDGEYEARWSRRTRVGGAWANSAEVPLGEAAESYDVMLLSAGGAVLGTQRVTEQRALLPGPTYAPPDAPSATIPTSLPDPLMEFGAQVQLQNSYDADAICMSFDIGSGPGQSVYWLDAIDLSLKEGIGFGAWRATQIASSATDIYVAVTNFDDPSYLYRIEKQLPYLEISADRTCPLAADAQGLAFDGTHVWLAETYSVKLRRLDAAALTIIDSYDYYCWDLRYDGGTGCLFLDSGDRVRQVDPSDGSQVAEFVVSGAVRSRPFVVGDLLFVCHTNGLKVFRISTGAVVNSMTSSTSDSIGAVAVDTGVEVAVALRDLASPEVASVLMFDRDAGAYVRSIDAPFLQHLAGFASGGLYGVFPGSIPSTYTSRLLMSVAGDGGGGGTGGVAVVPGMKVRVQQISHTVGRGFAAEATI